MVLMKSVHAISMVFLTPLRRFNMDDDYIEFVTFVVMRTYSYTVDFLNMITLLYLFYVQAENSLSKRETENPENMMRTLAGFSLESESQA